MFPMKIWCVEHDRVPVLGGASVGGFCSRHQLLVLRLSLLRVSLHLLNLEDQESYSQQMTEKYAGEDEQPQLDPEVWVAASGASKKGHVYSFGHSMDTSRVLSGTSSSASQTSAFNTRVGAPGTSPSDMMGFIANTISGLESHLAQTMETRLAQTMDTRLVQMQTQVTDALQAQLSQTLSQIS
ncbi:hypothetical protein Taro_042977 [Colocasia esculenta]|uniref:Uncharacterized protein n=1 Tax=Colocasia esculenta TaxID=4460 RepID=A0A843WUC9_COLES|nr:hypothetical protein [Colocasia esculenta]